MKSLFNRVKTILLFALLCTFVSCQKDKRIAETKKDVESILFDLSDVNDIDILKVADYMKKEGEVKDYLQYFLSENGVPSWKNAMHISNQGQYYVIIPLIKQTATEVEGFIVAKKLSIDSKIKFALFNKSFMKYYGFSRSVMFNAMNVQLLLNKFNRKIFNKKSGKISYAMQLPLDIRQKYPTKIDPKFLTMRFKDASSSSSGTRGFTTSCITITDEVEVWFDPTFDDEECHCSGDEYYLYTVTEVMTFCFDSSSGGGNFGDDNWWIANSTIPTGGGGGGTPLTTEQKLNAMLQPGDTYEFVNNDPNGPMVPWDEEPANYATVEAFEAAISNLRFRMDGVYQSGADSQRISKFQVDRSPGINLAGVEIQVKIDKDTATNKFKTVDVSSTEYGITLAWSWSQTSYSSNIDGNNLVVDVYGTENYNLFLESIGTLFKKRMHYRLKLNRTTGEQISIEWIKD